MAASIATSAFLQMSSRKSSLNLVGGPNSSDIQGISAKPASSSRGLQVKANAQIVTKTKGVKVEDDGPNSVVPRIFYNQLPDWSVLLAAITAIFWAAEKQWTAIFRAAEKHWTLLGWKRPRRPDMLSNAFVLGKIVENGLFYRQNFSIRSYEIGVDSTASTETLLNHLQESAINHVKCAGILGDGLGSTPMMNQRNLIRVIAKMQVSVEHYPSWEDVVEVHTWVSPSGKKGVCRYWIVRDYQTGQTIMKATSTCVMMNKHTRRFSKIPEDIREELKHIFSESCSVIMDEESRKLTKLNVDTADSVCSGLIPRWGDLDVTRHVNNVKYIGWVLESTPTSILESHELASMTLEFRKECGRDSVLQSLTAASANSINGSQAADIECQHLLRLESGAEVVRGLTEWRPKLQQTQAYHLSVENPASITARIRP